MKGYELQEKCYKQGASKGFASLAHALDYMQKLICENCKIDEELEAIREDGLPAPRYRASVAKYLEDFFVKGKRPSHKIIDYSDYEGTPRVFDADSFSESAGFKRFKGVTGFERGLGFVFAAGEGGMQFSFLDDRMLCYFKRYRETAFFGVEYSDTERVALDVRILQSDGEYLATLRAPFYPLLLLDILLKQKNKMNARALGNKMCHRVYEAMNGEGLAVSVKIEFSKNDIVKYLPLLREFGYDVKTHTVTVDSEYYTKDGERINREKKKYSYYIPPFICKRDADIILGCIARAALPEGERKGLAEKFMGAVGYDRYAEDAFEESAIPKPRRYRCTRFPDCKTGCEWPDRFYALVIYHTLLFCARPLPITSKRKESIQGLVEKYYGVEIDRRKVIPNHAASMVAAGLSVQRTDGEYCFDTSALLTKDDIDNIEKCITESDIEKSEKERLIQKLNDKFPIGKY